ncbi:hypothetical protein CEXT_612321 [Caerostris extrusa]|uniref:Uncharacterized protein n=1 Tax=Caerostris extrusa TaxID=172846 RepID=A0AAV4PR17_CAEEX|nr:hypothetical protein CEXT_612321 [Caerostris extrusa]
MAVLSQCSVRVQVLSLPSDYMIEERNQGKQDSSMVADLIAAFPSSLSYLVRAENTVQSSEHGYCISARVREHKWRQPQTKVPHRMYLDP